MKKIITISVIGLLSVFLIYGNALAIHNFDFGGVINFANNGGGDEFAETLVFERGFIPTFNTADDALFNDTGGALPPYGDRDNEEYIEFSDLILDPSDYVSGEYYSFLDDGYQLELFDHTGDRIFYGDLFVDKLIIFGQIGHINPYFNANLTNIVADDSYIMGSSTIADGFINRTEGSIQFSTQFGNAVVIDAIENGIKPENTLTYSGTAAAAAAPVPEPATIILLGMGLAGLALYRRRQNS